MLIDDGVAVDVQPVDDGHIRVVVLLMDGSQTTVAFTVPRRIFARSIRRVLAESYASDDVIIALVRRQLRTRC